MAPPRLLPACLFTAVLVLPVLGQPPAPPPPPARPAAPLANVVIRYQIDAFPNERIPQFREMTDYFRAVGLDRAPGPEDEAVNRQVTRTEGTIPTASARKLLQERHVRSILLWPTGTQLPVGDEPVRVSLELAAPLRLEPGEFLYGTPAVRRLEQEGGPLLQQQRRLADQVRSVLLKQGFEESVGYDTRASTRLVGTIPASRLSGLLEDLRQTPEGRALPLPFASLWPVRVVEVLPAVKAAPARPVVADPAAGLAKLTPEVRELLKGDAADKRTRMEVILAVPLTERCFEPQGSVKGCDPCAPCSGCGCGERTPAARPGDEVDPAVYLRQLESEAPGLVIEGRLGPVATVLATPREAAALGRLLAVSTVRLPRSGEARLVGAAPAGAAADALLRDSGLARLHTLGQRGRGMRLAVIDGDFRGWQAEVGKGLPAGTQLVDLTAELQGDLRPAPFPSDTTQPGPGTQAALVAAKAAPEADLVLVRLDPESPYQLRTVMRAINGEAPRSFNLERRAVELDLEEDRLQRESARLAREKQIVFEGLDDDPASRDKRLETYQKDLAKLEDEQRQFRDTMRRYLDLEEAVRGLKTVRVVANALVWPEGWPVDGGNPLSRCFDAGPFSRAFWFQAAGDTRGQAWVGPFRDREGDGVMEFIPPGQPLPAGALSPSLNFLGWRPAGALAGAPPGGPPEANLPAGARLRLSVQWREPHDPSLLKAGEDAYRKPLADMRLVVLRQLDPTGRTRPADDFEVAAQSVGLPQRLDNQPGSAVYEQTVELPVKEAGRYAVRVEGLVPEGTRPAGVASLPALQTRWEMRPRLFVQTLDGPGRAVLETYSTAEGSLGMPADARSVLTVGSATPGGQPAAASAPGPVFNVAMLSKPDVLSYGGGEQPPAADTALAASFAAGLAATAAGAGLPPGPVLPDLRVRPGDVLRVPADWPGRGR